MSGRRSQRSSQLMLPICGSKRGSGTKGGRRPTHPGRARVKHRMRVIAKRWIRTRRRGCSRRGGSSERRWTTRGGGAVSPLRSTGDSQQAGRDTAPFRVWRGRYQGRPVGRPERPPREKTRRRWSSVRSKTSAAAMPGAVVTGRRGLPRRLKQIRGTSRLRRSRKSLR